VTGTTAFGTLMDQLAVSVGGTSATVTSLAQTEVSVNDFAAAFAGLTVTTNGGNISGFLANSWSDPNGSGGSTLELLGDVLVPGSLTAEKISTGMGTNRLTNTEFLQGTLGWDNTWSSGHASATATTHSVRAAGANWSGDYYNVMQIYQSSGTNDTGSYDLEYRPPFTSNGTGRGARITGGDWIEASAKIAAIYCKWEMRVKFYDLDGGFVANSDVLSFLDLGTGQSPSPNNPDLWVTYGGKFQSPANAAYASFWIRKKATTSGAPQNYSYIFIYQPQLCVVHADATDLTPYSSGGTSMITGDTIRTGSLLADNVNTTSFAASGLAVFGDSLESDDYSAGSAGWMLDIDGNMELNQLVVRNSIVDGAVSNNDIIEVNAETAYDDLDTVALISMVPSEGILPTDMYIVSYRCEIRSAGTYNPAGTPLTNWTELRLLVRLKSGGSWGSWTELDDTPKYTGNSWTEIQDVNFIIRDADEMEVQTRITIANPLGTNGGITQTNIKNMALSVRAVKR